MRGLDLMEQVCDCASICTTEAEDNLSRPQHPPTYAYIVSAVYPKVVVRASQPPAG